MKQIKKTTKTTKAKPKTTKNKKTIFKQTEIKKTLSKQDKEILKFCNKNQIKTNKKFNSFYFRINEKNYRISTTKPRAKTYKNYDAKKYYQCIKAPSNELIKIYKELKRASI